MAQDLTSIFQQIALIQKAITPPPGQSSAGATDEPAEVLGTFPMFINWEAATDIITTEAFGAATPQNYYSDIRMSLLFAPTGQKYSTRARRAWVKPVIDAFRQNAQLNATITGLNIDRVNYDSVDINGTHYEAATFVARVMVSS